eukprot:449836_1
MSAYGPKGYFEKFPTVNFRYPGMYSSDRGELFAFLVDKSGSMSSNNKLQQVKNATGSMGLTYDNSTFYTFNTEVQYIGNKDAFDKVKPSGGTKIGKALEWIIKEAQSIASGRCAIHFIIITDAEDKMTSSECDYLKNLYDNAVTSARKSSINVSGSCFLVGKGQCKTYLETIFYGNFYHTTDESQVSITIEKIHKIEVDKKTFIDEIIKEAKIFKKVEDTTQEIEINVQSLDKNKNDTDQLISSIKCTINNLNDAHVKNKIDIQIDYGLDLLERSGLDPRIRDSDYDQFQQTECQVKKYEKKHYNNFQEIKETKRKLKDLLNTDESLLLDNLYGIQSEFNTHQNDLSNDINGIKRLKDCLKDFTAKSFRVNCGAFPQLSNRITCVKNKLDNLNSDKQNIINEVKDDLLHMNNLCEQQIINLELDVNSIKKTFESSVNHINHVLAMDFDEIIDELLTSNNRNTDMDDEKKDALDAAENLNALELSELIFANLNDTDSDLKRYKTKFVHYDIKCKDLQIVDNHYLRDVMNIKSEIDRKRILDHISNVGINKLIATSPLEKIARAKADFVQYQMKIESHLKVIQCLNKQLRTRIDSKSSENVNEENSDELINILKSQQKKIETVLAQIKTDKIDEKFNVLIPFMETINKMKDVKKINMESFNQSFDRIYTFHSNKSTQIDDETKGDVRNVIQTLEVIDDSKDENLLEYKQILLNAKTCGLEKETASYLEQITQQINDRNKIKMMELKFQSMEATFGNIHEYKKYYKTKQIKLHRKEELDNMKKQFAMKLALCDENAYNKLIKSMAKLGNDLKYNDIVLTKMHQIMERDLGSIDSNDIRITTLIDQVNQYGEALSNASKNTLKFPKQLMNMKDAMAEQQFNLFVLKQEANDLYNRVQKPQMEKDEKQMENVEFKQQMVMEQKEIQQNTIDKWDKMQVGNWLQSLDSPYSNYKDLFISNDINGGDLLDDDFNDEFLENDLGIKSKLKRKKLLSKINELKTNSKMNNDEDIIDID